MNPRRSYERLFYCLISVMLAVSTARAQSPSLTTITDTIYRADGTPAAGQLVITWPAFTTAANNAVAAGEKTITLGASGALSTQLAPNEGATPAGSYYKVVYKLSYGTTATEYWTVPIATPTNVGLIRATVVPSQVAAQLVTRQYVDNVLGAADIVHKASPETITGVKTFSASPVVPTPSGTSDAANKSYVDTQLSVIAPNGTRIGNIRQAHLFPGANAGAKINACIADLPATGGTCDARGFEGAQAITTSIVVDRPAVLILGAAVFQFTGAGEFAVTSSLRALGTLQTTNNLTTGTILQVSKAGCAFRFPLGPSSKIGQFELGNFQVQGGGGSYDNCLVDVPSTVGGSFSGSQARWYFHDLWIAGMGSAATSKAALNFGDSVYWLSFERIFASNNRGGSINAGYADDLNVTHSMFSQLSANQPHLRFVAGSYSHVCENEFENNTGSTQPDILLQTETNSQRGFIELCKNKHGGEQEGGRNAKIRAYSASFPNALISSVWVTDNQVSGLDGSNPIPGFIQIDNPVSDWHVVNNHAYNVSTLINDVQPAANTGGGKGIIRNNTMVPPKTGSRLCTNGCRGFWIGDRLLNVADAPFDLAKQTETSELRNRLSWSEDLSNAAWVKSSGITVTTGQTDPYGTTRAVQLANNGTTSGASLRAPINIAGIGNRVFVRFWAKAGTLDRLDVLLEDTTSAAPSDGMLQQKLPGGTNCTPSGLCEYKTSFTVLNPAHNHDLYLYVGDSSQTNTGNLTVFGIQVSDYDSDYVRTAGASFVDTNFGARFERKVEFARDIIVAGSSSSPTTNKFQITGASTGGTRTVTLADANSVTVVPDTGAANNFLTGITNAGVITKAQPNFASLTGNVAVSQLNSGTGASASTFWRGDGTWAAPANPPGAVPDPTNEEWMHESWCGGFSASGQIGTLGWRAAGFGSGTAGLDSYGATAGVGGGCAIQFRQATATANAGLIMYLGGPDVAAQSQFNASAWWIQSSINLETTTSETVRFGKSSTTGGETGTDGAFIRYIGGTDTQFVCEVIKAGVVTTSGIGVTPLANTWYKARIDRDASGNITCTVNASAVTIGAANTPGGVAMFDIFEVKSLTAAQWRLRSRYYEQHWTGLAR